MIALVMGPCESIGVSFHDIGGNRPLGKFSPKDTPLRNACERLAKWIEHEFEAVASDWEWHFDDVRLPALGELQRLGAELVTELAGIGERERFVDTLSGISHLCTSFDMHIPWEFLYLGDPTAEVSLDNFFGAKAAIGRAPTVGSSRVRARPHKLGADKGPLGSVPAGVAPYGYAEDIRLTSAKDGSEFSVFTDLGIHPKRLDPLSEFRPSRDGEAQ